jgi:hypothetical protein
MAAAPEPANTLAFGAPRQSLETFNPMILFHALVHNVKRDALLTQ